VTEYLLNCSDSLHVVNCWYMQVVGLYGLHNLGNTCFVNSTVQMLRTAAPLVSQLESHLRTHGEHGQWCLILGHFSAVFVYCYGHEMSTIVFNLGQIFALFGPSSVKSGRIWTKLAVYKRRHERQPPKIGGTIRSIAYPGSAETVGVFWSSMQNSTHTGQKNPKKLFLRGLDRDFSVLAPWEPYLVVANVLCNNIIR